jgi:hypothetical protein
MVLAGATERQLTGSSTANSKQMVNSTLGRLSALGRAELSKG